MSNPYTQENIIAYMAAWYLTNFEDPAENTPVDDGEYVYIWGDPISPQEALSEEFYHLFSEALINETAAYLVKKYDIFEWVPVPRDEEDENAGEDDQASGKEAP